MTSCAIALTLDGTALSGVDYVSNSGLLTFAPGVTTQTVTVEVNGDPDVENDETLSVALTDASGASIDHALAQGTIVNDDFGTPPPPVTVSITSTSVAEGNAGTTPLIFTVNLSGPSIHPVTVDYLMAGATAEDGVDFVGTSGTLTFSPGETAKTISVNAIADTNVEDDESFIVTLLNATGATIDQCQGEGLIVNDDVISTAPPIRVSIDSPSTSEGNTGTTTLSFSVSLSAASDTQGDCT